MVLIVVQGKCHVKNQHVWDIHCISGELIKFTEVGTVTLSLPFV